MPRAIPKAAKPKVEDPRKSVPMPAVYIRALLRRFATDHAMRARLLAGTDVDVERLADQGAELTLFSLVTISENLTRILGEGWPLEVAHVWSSAMQGALEVAARSAPTVGACIEVLARYGHVRGPFLDLAIARDRTRTAILLGTRVALTAATRRALIETATLSACAVLDEVLEAAGSQVAIHFSWAPPGHAARFAAAIGREVAYSQHRCAVLVPNTLLERASPFADSALHASAVEELEQAARRIRGDDLLGVRVVQLFKRRRVGRLSEDEAARELGMSRRTLVRRLSAAGMSYRALLDANLKQRAAQMLEERVLTREKMAEALGFQDPTSFSRACRRWFEKA